ncbi:Hypothetical protein NTJ_06062 [Nesidiocoris tenuis]|uniref:Uncharacterized protein n=1 Tax=Nesidiocoris tenuis TaxID=355587 RepID=A0ABN7ALY7_9HEMI|nr:Hypothetical protein NTJ_06062 [Nesidiocoris tenuis]
MRTTEKGTLHSYFGADLRMMSSNREGFIQSQRAQTLEPTETTWRLDASPMTSQQLCDTLNIYSRVKFNCENCD